MTRRTRPAMIAAAAQRAREGGKEGRNSVEGRERKKSRDNAAFVVQICGSLIASVAISKGKTNAEERTDGRGRRAQIFGTEFAKSVVGRRTRSAVAAENGQLRNEGRRADDILADGSRPPRTRRRLTDAWTERRRGGMGG